MVHTDFRRLFALQDPFNSRYFRGRVLFAREIDRNALLVGDFGGVTEPLKVGHADGRLMADIVWTDNVAVILISKRLIVALRKAGFSGWTTYPVDLETNEGIHPEYSGLTITGRSGPIDNSRGQWICRDDEPGRFLRGLYFDEQSWDGTDFFVPQRTIYPLITQPVRDCLHRLEVKNVRCDQLAEVLRSELVVRNTPQVP